MTTKLEQAARQALDALETDEQWGFVNKKVLERRLPAITALREALAEQPDMNLNCKSVQARLATSWGYVRAEQAEQEPVDFEGDAWVGSTLLPEGTKLYAAPVRTKDLTEYEIDELRFQNLNYLDFARAVIAADRENNK